MKIRTWNRIFLAGGIVIIIFLIKDIIATTRYNDILVTSLPLRTAIFFVVLQYVGVGALIFGIYMIIRKWFRF